MMNKVWWQAAGLKRISLASFCFAAEMVELISSEMR
jgi:hypothetical protein